ncbi:MAG TPA: hypothetical protein IGS51_19490 [Thermoleptolyngbya sp. M55_K2018_002]|nr:hypothetical protein [Thermoleptolyngbya sp. M55_K2018_002]
MRRNLIELATGMREIDGAAYSAEAVQAAALALAIGGDVQTALAITRSMPKSEPVEQARTLQAIATIAGELGETDQVQSLLQEAFAAANAIPNQDGDNDYYQRVSKVERLSEIAFVANEFGETSLAQTALKEALTIAKTLQPGFREDSASRQIAFDET